MTETNREAVTMLRTLGVVIVLIFTLFQLPRIFTPTLRVAVAASTEPVAEETEVIILTPTPDPNVMLAQAIQKLAETKGNHFRSAMFELRKYAGIPHPTKGFFDDVETVEDLLTVASRPDLPDELRGILVTVIHEQLTGISADHQVHNSFEQFCDEYPEPCRIGGKNATEQ